MIRPVRIASLLIVCALAFATLPARAQHRFTGIESCATSGCHGGGAGNNQVQIHKKDQHANAHVAMGQATWSNQLVQNLGITNAYASARCNVCHAPNLTLPPEKFFPDMTAAKAGTGVSCESCHGPAEFWLRSHTRPDYTHEMRTQIGLRNMRDFYSRANVCVGCHQNLDPEIVANGHVPLTFELDDYDTRETAHWRDKGDWLGPKRWLTGQAVALREISWMLTKPYPAPGAAAGVKDMEERWQAISWLLRKTDLGAALPAGRDYAATQTASDRLARAAANEPWTKARTQKAFSSLAALRQEFGPVVPESAPAAAKRGYYLAIALRRLYIALRDEAAYKSENIEKAIDSLFELARNETTFDGPSYGRLLEQIEVELARN